MARFTTYLNAPIEIDSLDLIGGGDADVNTKDGRVTYVRVNSTAPRVPSNRNSIYLTVTYEVEETHKNYTHLRGETTVEIQADSGMRIMQIGPGGADIHYNGTFRREDHKWHTITNEPGVAGSYAKERRMKFDGDGDDDQGNAQLSGQLEIPVTVEVADDIPTNPLQEIVAKSFKVSTMKRFPLHRLGA